MNRFLMSAAVVTSFATINQATADITYVDAVEGVGGNTYATGGSLADTSWINPDTGSGGDNDQWKKRAFSNNGSVFQSRWTTDEMPELTTEISGLSDGVYDVWVFFWDATDGGVPNQWTIAAGLTSGALTSYSFDGPGDTASTVAASTLTFDVEPLLTEGTLTMYGVNIGEATVTSSSTINVFIDDLTNAGGSGTFRTWYDGVGYELVPEPTSFGLLAIGGLLVTRRRRV